VALDTYFRGNSEEKDFCEQIGAGGNHVVVTTARGEIVGKDRELRLRQLELAPVLDEFHALPESQRTAPISLGANATPPERPVPAPPKNGLILRGFCSYLGRDENGRVFRPTQYYYRENPDRWATETQSDMLWLTESDWKSLVPRQLQVGAQIEVPELVQHRFFCTIGIDYMEGSVNSLPCRASRMQLTVTEVNDEAVNLRLDGYAHIGHEFGPQVRNQPNSRGCEVRVLGQLEFNRQRAEFNRFDIVGVGQAWGNKMEYLSREIRLDDYPWSYGIACELVTTRTPMDLIPPYNLLHYNSSGSYFGDE